MAIQHIHSVSEFEELLKSDKYVIVDFFATWCGPCKMIAPKFEKLAGDFPNAIFAKVDVDELPDIAASASVRSMPTFHIYKDGQKVDVIVGANPTKLIGAVTAVLA
ncbi:thioredoxine 2 [Basidiobolus meristosporus CBS 931.73]|uniref:Thioredoxin n=1 Tax=Basidiobolus meristosporus CBS 931.73 TaxID=1314790 RepID=A0A1Y1XZ54_9FUNG|nr:thioredoxine 2 [Basidiobolus meristosporus CBS 931.73]|eukprot:ORX91002.1 thioredoxine 2 [Basidiobolus meristosporus CBS 931.73]